MRWLLLFVLVCLVAVGCKREMPAPKKLSPAPAAEKPQTEAVAITASEPPVETPPQAPPAPEPTPPPPYEWGDEQHRERIALLTPGGPLIVDCWITIAGEPHSTEIDRLIDEMLAAAETNGDRRPTWKQWRENDEYFSRVLPDAAPNRRQLEQWVEKYDQNSNKRIERREAASWLGRSDGRTAVPLSLRSLRTIGQGSDRESLLWNLLDADASGGLDQAETQTATSRFRALDADDDRVLETAELTPLAQQLGTNQGATRSYGNASRRHAALHFGTQFDSGRLSYLLANLYSPRGSLTPASFTAFPNLFAELDSDGDDYLSDDDLARLLEIAPHLRLAITMTNQPDRAARIDQIEIDPRVEQLRLIRKSAASRVVLELSGTRIAISVHDLSATLSDAQQLRGSQIQLMVHDQGDATFDCLDENADGLLGEREIATASERLAACDDNRDGVLTPSELPYTMVVAFTRGENPAATNFYTPATPTATTVDGESLDWFAAADFNSDGDLSRHEFLGPAADFDALDQNGDEFITPDEAAQQANRP